MKNSKKSNPMKFSKKIVIFCIIIVVIYTAVQICMNFLLGMEISPTLTTCVYAFFGTELAASAAIKIFEREERKSIAEETDLSDNFRIDS